MTHTLTYSEALERITIAAKGREDYVNAVKMAPGHPQWEDWMTQDDVDWASCEYLNKDRTPSCIVGHAFAVELLDAGLTPEDPANREGVTGILCELLGMTLTRKAAMFLITVQTSQDSGKTWGRAIELGISKSRRYPDDETYKNFT